MNFISRRKNNIISSPLILIICALLVTKMNRFFIRQEIGPKILEVPAQIIKIQIKPLLADGDKKKTNEYDINKRKDKGDEEAKWDEK